MLWNVVWGFTGAQIGGICHPSDNGFGDTGMASEGSREGEMVGNN